MESRTWFVGTGKDMAKHGFYTIWRSMASFNKIWQHHGKRLFMSVLLTFFFRLLQCPQVYGCLHGLTGLRDLDGFFTLLWLLCISMLVLSLFIITLFMLAQIELFQELYIYFHASSKGECVHTVGCTHMILAKVKPSKFSC